MIRASLTAAASAVLSLVVSAQTVPVPRIWDDGALADWATPVAALNVRPAHYSSAEYYAAPVDNLRTYPVYHPDAEPPGYWAELQKKKPEPLIDVHHFEPSMNGSSKESDSSTVCGSSRSPLPSAFIV